MIRMNVYLCYSNYFDYAENWERVELVVDSKEKAEKWVNEITPNEQDSRFYTEMEVK